MNTATLIKKVRAIEIKARGLSNHIFAGAYQTAFKGKGMDFSEVREYTPGDDVRDIEWNVTARFNQTHVKVYDEDRALNLMLMIDVSNSINFAAQQKSKREIVAELAATLAFAALKNNDQVGAIFFAGKIEYYIPPKKGKQHVLSIIRAILTVEATSHQTTNFKEAIYFMNKVSKRKNIVFLLSDFMGELPDKELRMAAIKHDLVGLNVKDPLDYELLDLGLIRVQDAETGQKKWWFTSKKETARNRQFQYDKQQYLIRQKFNKYRASLVDIDTQEDYFKNLQLFFKRR